MSNFITAQTELASKYVGKQYLQLGANEQLVLVYDLASGLVGQLPTANYHALAQAGRVLNPDETVAKHFNIPVEASLQISKTRLKSVIDGNHNEKGILFVFNRYTDSKDKTVAYLVLQVTATTVSVKRYTTETLISIVERGTQLLNAKLTTVAGQKAIQGINGELAVTKVEDITVAPTAPVVQPNVKAPKESEQKPKGHEQEPKADAKYLDRIVARWVKGVYETGTILNGNSKPNSGAGGRVKDMFIYIREVIGVEQRENPQLVEAYLALYKKVEMSNKRERTEQRPPSKGIRTQTVDEAWEDLKGAITLYVTHKILTDPSYNKYKQYPKKQKARKRDNGRNTDLRYYKPSSSAVNLIIASAGELKQSIQAIHLSLVGLQEWSQTAPVDEYFGDEGLHFYENFTVPKDYMSLSHTRHKVDPVRAGRYKAIREAREAIEERNRKLFSSFYTSTAPLQGLDMQSAEMYAHFKFAKNPAHVGSNHISPFYGEVLLQPIQDVLSTPELQAEFTHIVKTKPQYALGSLLLAQLVQTRDLSDTGRVYTPYRLLLLYSLVSESFVNTLIEQAPQGAFKQLATSRFAHDVENLQKAYSTANGNIKEEIHSLLETCAKWGTETHKNDMSINPSHSVVVLSFSQVRYNSDLSGAPSSLVSEQFVNFFNGVVNATTSETGARDKAELVVKEKVVRHHVQGKKVRPSKKITRGEQKRLEETLVLTKKRIPWGRREFYSLYSY